MTARPPALVVALAFVCGLALPAPDAGLALGLAAACLLAALVSALRARLVLGTALAIAGFAALGLAAQEIRALRSERASLRALAARSWLAPRQVTGRLREEPRFSPDVAVLTLDAEALRSGRAGLEATGGLRVSVGGELVDRLTGLAAGDVVRLWARLRPARGQRNPGGFDAASYLERERVDLLGSTKSALLVERLGEGRGLGSVLSRLREGALERLERALGPGPDLGVVAALVTGDRSRLDARLERRFRRAGVFHVMAISGAHVAILALLVHRLFRRAGMDEAPALSCLLVLLPLYAGFCGGRPPVARAAIMAGLVLLARLLSLDRPHANALGLGALLLLAWDPASISDPGFQLSFAAMASLLALFEAFRSDLAWLPRLGPPLAISFSAQVGVVPVAAWHFQRVAPIAPLASLAAIPLASAVVVLGFALVAFGGLPGAGALLAALTHVAVALLVGSAELFARVPFASVDTGRPGLLWVVVYAAALLTALGGVASRSRRLRWIALAVAGALVVLLLPGARNPPNEISLTAIDVGHGDALVLRLPGGENLLVDGGGAPGSSFDVGDAVVLPYLRATGVRRLDAVLLTHTDYDHLGGLLTVVEEIPVGAIWEGPPRYDRAAYRLLRERAVERGVPFRRLAAGERFEMGGVRFEVLAAGGLGALKPLESNDQSVVLRLVYGRSRLLLTGDAEGPVEDALARVPERSRADVLKVAHHGSRTSTSAAFLAAVSPRLAVISGRRSEGRPLPSLEVLERLRARGIETLRTDVSGAVTVRLDADGRARVETFLPRD